MSAPIGEREIRRATEAEKVQRDRVTHEAWGQRLSLDDYMARERALRAHPFAAAGMDTWVLVADGVVLSSLETFRGHAVTATGGYGRSYGVASVFTETALRGNGHSATLLAGVLRTIERDDPKALASVLFSDVGAPLYERSGYRAVPDDEVVFTPQRSAFRGTPIYRGEAPFTVPGPAFGLVATPLQIDWHHERQAVYAAFLGRTEPPAVGVRVGDHHLVWVADFKKDALLVLGFHGDEASGETLLATARHVAAEGGLSSVIAWGAEGLPPASTLLGKRQPREGALVMLAPLHGTDVEPLAPVSRAFWC